MFTGACTDRQDPAAAGSAGMDAKGSFLPDATIPREQVAAMATRVADPALRKAFTLS